MAELTLPCLSIRQPWAWAIVNGFKPVENRTWPTKVRGPILVHAGLKEERGDIEFVLWQVAAQTGRPVTEIGTRYRRECALGVVVGSCAITDCVTAMDSPWFFGPYGFVVGAVRRCTPVPMKGRLGFFRATVDWQPASADPEVW